MVGTSSKYQELEEGLARLNRQQYEAVMHEGSPLLIAAAAGSGKTATIVHRAARQVRDGVPPEGIVLVTFTNRAAAEFRERLVRLLGPEAKGIWTGTLHGLGACLLRRFGQEGGFDPRFKIYDSSDTYKLVKRIRDQLGLELSPASLVWQIGSYKGRMLTSEEVAREVAADLTRSREERRVAEVFAGYQDALVEEGAMDFADLVGNAVRLLERCPAVREQAAPLRILLDEAQDIDIVQLRMIKLLLPDPTAICAVGDSDQCQPPGTQVLTTEGYVSIEDLDPDHHRVLSFSRSQSCVLGLKDGYAFQKAVRSYRGRMLNVNTSVCSTRCTPNHRWLVKWHPDAKQPSKHAIYLMRQGARYRVGWCRLFNADGNFHVGIRSRIEKADAAWILEVVEDRTEASIRESYYSAQYGIPTIPFQPVNGATHLTADAIDRFFSLFDKGDLAERAVQLLQACGRSHEFPFWQNNRDWKKCGRHSLMLIEASNLVDQLMVVPVHLQGKQTSWETVSLSQEYYWGPVYSLEVQSYETYIADGIVTHNSIYGWRLADPRIMMQFGVHFPGTKVLSLGQNYRSTRGIVDATAAVIGKNAFRIPHRIWSENGEGYPVCVVPTFDARDEVTRVTRLVLRHHEELGIAWKDMAVLYRTGFQSQAMEEALVMEKVPYSIAGRRFWERKEILDTMAWFRVLWNETDLPALERLVIHPLYGTRTTWKNVRDHAKESGVPAWSFLAGEVLPGSSKKDTERQAALAALYFRLRLTFEEGELSTLLEEILYGTGIWNHYGEEDSEAERRTGRSHQENLEHLQTVVTHGWDGPAKTQLPEFLTHALLMGDGEDQEQDAVRLGTLHSSKGLEWRVVHLIGVEDGLLPHYRSLQGEDAEMGIEEERRLFYVGMTRAKELLYLWHAGLRAVPGGGAVRSYPSRYLREIPEELVCRYGMELKS